MNAVGWRRGVTPRNGRLTSVIIRAGGAGKAGGAGWVLPDRSSQPGRRSLPNLNRRFARSRKPSILGLGICLPSYPLERPGKVEPDIVLRGVELQRPFEFGYGPIGLIAGPGKRAGCRVS